VLLVYSLLLGFLMTGIYAAFSISQLFYESAQGATTAQQEAIKALNAAIRLLSEGRAATLATSSGGPAGLRLLSARTATGAFQHDSAGELLWQRWSCLYLDSSSGTLVLKEQPLTTPTTVIPSPAPTVAALAANSALTARTVARDVKALSFPSVAAGEVAVQVTVETRTRKFGANQVILDGRLTLKM
jgi:hypothetical protein